MNSNLRVMLAVLLLGSVGLSGCDKGPDPEEQRAQTVNNLAGKLSTAVTAVSDEIANSSSTDAATSAAVARFRAAGIKGLQGSGKLAFVNGLASKAGSMPGLRRMGRLLQETADEGEDPVEAALKLILANPEGSGDTYTYHPNGKELCKPEDGVITDQTGYDACVDEWKQITIVQNVKNDNEGTLKIKYSGEHFVTIGYGKDYIYVEAILPGIEAAVTAMAEVHGETAPTFPDTFLGAVRFTVTILGEEHVALTLGVTEALNVAGTAEGKTASIQIAVTEKVIEVTADGINNKASIEVALAAVTAMFPIPNYNYETNGTMHQGKVTISGVTGLLNLDNNLQTLVASGLGLGTSKAIKLEVDTVTAMQLTLANIFGFSVDGATAKITISTADLDFTMASDASEPSLNTDLTGDVNINVPVATVLQALQDPVTYDDITKVVSGGPVVITATGDYADAASSLSVSAGSCFKDNPNYLQNFPWVTADCP